MMKPKTNIHFFLDLAIFLKDKETEIIGIYSYSKTENFN